MCRIGSKKAHAFAGNDWGGRGTATAKKGNEADKADSRRDVHGRALTKYRQVPSVAE